MNKCPFCGSDKGYYQYEYVERALIFDFEGEPNGSTEDISIKSGKRRYCYNCNRILPKKMFEGSGKNEQ